MSTIYTFPTHYEDDTSDSLSSAGTKSSSLDSLETPSPHFLQLSEMCDIDTLSSQPKKIRKKRCAYDKIDDEKRIQLLNAVQKTGESLKSAAKRLDINYSSAKSILHTFRKEGRILKKSPLETGSRPFSMTNLPSTMDISPINNASNGFPQRYPSQGCLPLQSNPAAAYQSTNGPNSPMRGLTSIFANLALDNDGSDEEPSFINLMLETSKPQPKEDHISIPKLNLPELTPETIPPQGEDNISENKGLKIPCLSEMTCNIPMPCSLPLTQGISHPCDLLKKIDNFYMNYSNSPLSGGKGNMFGDCSDSGSRKFCGEFDSFSDMLTAFQVQAPHTDEVKGDFQASMFCRHNSNQFAHDKMELKLIKEDSTDSSSGAESNGLESYAPQMGSQQWVFCESFRKASFLNNLNQFQKPGISLINERNK